MWPKAIAQLIELAPHISRILPLADRFFQSKSASEDSARRAMDAMAEGLRGDLGQVTASHAGLYQKLNEQSDALTVLASEVHRLQSAADAADARSASLERLIGRQASALRTLLIITLLCSLAGLLLLGILLAHHR